jgi:hypothetical protein
MLQLFRSNRFPYINPGPVDTAYHGEMAVKLVAILRKTARN